MSDTPYRTPRAEDAPPPLLLWPLFHRRLAAFALVLMAAPFLLFLFLWSRMVTVACDPLPEGAWACVVREETIVSAHMKRVVLRDVVRVEVAGETQRSRGDAWIEVVTSSGVVRLTRGFAEAKGQQLALARALEGALTAGRQRFVGGYGSRWLYALVPALAIAVGALLLMITGLRVVARIDPRHRVLVIARSHVPLPASRVSVELDHVGRFDVGSSARGHSTVDLVLRTGERATLFRAMDPVREVDRLRQWLEASRS